MMIEINDLLYFALIALAIYCFFALYFNSGTAIPVFLIVSAIVLAVAFFQEYKEVKKLAVVKETAQFVYQGKIHELKAINVSKREITYIDLSTGVAVIVPIKDVDVVRK
ncbi:MAG: hypothetical protein HY265_03680 [Deltaproteobacteria bacterium]|nr:hypothetical protein [Deltaproteobacteria bacterium]